MYKLLSSKITLLTVGILLSIYVLLYLFVPEAVPTFLWCIVVTVAIAWSLAVGIFVYLLYRVFKCRKQAGRVLY